MKDFRQMKQRGEKISALTAYDYPTARLLDESGIDIILVGDSLGMVVLGCQDTTGVTLEEMLHHTRAVTRGVKQALLVADAFALALFTIIGARKGITLAFSGSVVVLLGVVTGVAGGILRDVLIGEVPLVFQPEIHLYATAGLCGATAFAFLRLIGLPDPQATGVGAALVLGLRLAGIRWRLSLPVFTARGATPAERSQLAP